MTRARGRYGRRARARSRTRVEKKTSETRRKSPGQFLGSCGEFLLSREAAREWRPNRPSVTPRTRGRSRRGRPLDGELAKAPRGRLPRNAVDGGSRRRVLTRATRGGERVEPRERSIDRLIARTKTRADRGLPDPPPRGCGSPTWTGNDAARARRARRSSSQMARGATTRGEMVHVLVFGFRGGTFSNARLDPPPRLRRLLHAGLHRRALRRRWRGAPPRTLARRRQARRLLVLGLEVGRGLVQVLRRRRPGPAGQRLAIFKAAYTCAGLGVVGAASRRRSRGAARTRRTTPREPRASARTTSPSTSPEGFWYAALASMVPAAARGWPPIIAPCSLLPACSCTHTVSMRPRRRRHLLCVSTSLTGAGAVRTRRCRRAPRRAATRVGLVVASRRRNATSPAAGAVPGCSTRPAAARVELHPGTAAASALNDAPLGAVRGGEAGRSGMRGGGERRVGSFSCKGRTRSGRPRPSAPPPRRAKADPRRLDCLSTPRALSTRPVARSHPPRPLSPGCSGE